MAIAFVLILSLGTYTRRESARGVVKSIDGEARVAVPAQGIIDTLYVHEGQRVRTGDVLLLVKTGRSGADGRPIDGASMASLDRELASLEERVRALDAAAQIDSAADPARLGALRAQWKAASAQESGLTQRLKLAREALVRVEPLANKGFISGEALRRRKEEVIALEQAVADARGAQARIDGQIGELQANAAQRPMSLVQERGRLLDLMAQSRRERDALAGNRQFTITAPVDGTITALQVARGQPIDPGRPPMTISRSGAGLQAEIFVPSRAIGFLEPGQRVRVRYEAFPFQRFGTAAGTVSTISSTVLKPQEVDAALRVEEPVFKVLITLEGDTVDAYGRRYRVRPGMALSADFVLDERSFGEWLLDPILALRGHL
nr:HlyD family efflux transporter periplasmic adaptor subunit [Sphingomonas naasensis]